MEPGHADRAQELLCLPILILGLSGEADDHIGGDRHAGQRLLRLHNDARVLFHIVASAHPLENRAAAALER